MAETVKVPEWQYHDQNIQGSISQNDFTRADRVILYSAQTPLPGKSSNAMNPIGLIQSLTHNEQKQLQLFFELGSDAPMIIPGLTSGQLNITRVLLNGLNFLNAVYHGVDKKNLRDDQVLRSIRDIMSHSIYWSLSIRLLLGTSIQKLLKAHCSAAAKSPQRVKQSQRVAWLSWKMLLLCIRQSLKLPIIRSAKAINNTRKEGAELQCFRPLFPL